MRIDFPVIFEPFLFQDSYRFLIIIICDFWFKFWNIQVIGLGPRLKLLGQLQNLSDEEISNGVSVSFMYDADVYNVETSFIRVSFEFNIRWSNSII